MRAKKLEELQVYVKAVEIGDEISAILERQSFERENRLREQLSGSSESVPSLIAEGFPQKTDRHFAAYLYRARGSACETRTHLHAAQRRHHISIYEEEDLSKKYVEIEKMLTRLIGYLNESDWRDRG